MGVLTYISQNDHHNVLLILMYMRWGSKIWQRLDRFAARFPSDHQSSDCPFLGLCHGGPFSGWGDYRGDTPKSGTMYTNNHAWTILGTRLKRIYQGAQPQMHGLRTVKAWMALTAAAPMSMSVVLPLQSCSTYLDIAVRTNPAATGKILVSSVILIG